MNRKAELSSSSDQWLFACNFAECCFKPSSTHEDAAMLSNTTVHAWLHIMWHFLCEAPCSGLSADTCNPSGNQTGDLSGQSALLCTGHLIWVISEGLNGFKWGLWGGEGWGGEEEWVRVCVWLGDEWLVWGTTEGHSGNWSCWGLPYGSLWEMERVWQDPHGADNQAV